MIQRIPKINIPATIAMCATFVLSAWSVNLLRSTQVRSCGMPVLPQRSGSTPARLIRTQPDAPIKIGSAEKRSSTIIDLIAKNVSGRVITGFSLALKSRSCTVSTWKYATRTGSQDSLDINQPYLWTYDSNWLGDRWAVDLGEDIEVWVDFVEFSDGTIWGPNTTGTLERMNAERMGSRQAALYYSWILRTRGPDAVLASFKEPITNSQLDAYDQVWRDSFDYGVRSVRDRLLDEEATYPRITTSLGPNPKRTNAMRTEWFQRILQSYINFRRQ